MRIDELQLQAVGPFTGRTIRFPRAGGSSGSDVHVIFGPNEAGKSSCLRAVRALLFGFPERAWDAFLHEPAKLRVGAVLEGGSRTISVVRRRGRNNTLLDPDGNPMDEDLLAGLLGRIGQDYFNAVFALDRQELESGSAEILEGKGDLGEALFSASIGGGRVHRLLASLEEEAGRLHRGRAHRGVIIPELLARLKDAREVVRGKLLRPADWAEAQEALERARAAAAERRDELHVLRVKRGRIERLVASMPVVAEWRAAARELEPLADVPPLSDDFPRRVEDCLDQGIRLTERARWLDGEIQVLMKRIAEARAENPLLELVPRFESLRRDWERHAEAWQDRGRLDRSAAETLGELRASAAGLGLDVTAMPDSGQWLELRRRLRVDPDVEERAADLGRRKGVVFHGLDAARNAFAAAEREVERLAVEIEKCGTGDSLASLASVVGEMNEAAARFAGIPELERECLRLEARVLGIASRLPVGPPPGARAPALIRVPPESTIRLHVDRAEELGRRMRALDDREEEERERLGEERRTLADLESAADGAAGTGRLEELRRLRDARWRELDASATGASEQDERRRLVEGFLAALHAVDREADRLVAQAEIIARAAQARRAVAAITARLEHLADERGRLEADCREADEAWRRWWGEWTGLPVMARPAEVAEVLPDWRALGEISDQWEAQRTHLERLRRDQDRACSVVRDLVGEPEPEGTASNGAGFSVLLERAREKLESARERRARRQEMAALLATARATLDDRAAELKSAQAQKEEWEKAWRATLDELGIPKVLEPSEIQAELRRRREIGERIDRLQEIENRRISLDEGSSAIRERMLELNAAVGNNADAAGDLDTGSLVEAVRLKLDAAIDDDRQRRRLEAELEEKRGEAERLSIEQQTLAAMRDSLCREARCGDGDDLRERAESGRTRRRLEEQRARLHAQLEGLAGAGKVDEWASEVDAAAERIDALKAEAAELDERIVEADRERALRLREEGEAQERLRAMDGGAASADAKAEAASLEAEIRSHVERFVRLRAAVFVLRREIEEFRERNQGPLLREAGRIFSELTNGAFAGLRAEFDASDRPVVAGVRGGDDSVPVEGMSEGTRDQLYLALRLAALERHLMRREPLPLLIDDLFVTFDDERSAALLRVLGELGRRTQVLVFTHHRHLVELARDVLGPDAGFVDLQPG